MNYNQFKTYLIATFNDIKEDSIKNLWEFYQSFVEELIVTPKEALMIIKNLYYYSQDCHYKALEEFYGAILCIDGKVNILGYNYFDNFSFEDGLNEVTKFFRAHGNEQRLTKQQREATKQYIYDKLEKKYQEYLYLKKHIEDYFRVELSEYGFSVDQELYRKNINDCVEIYKFFEDNNDVLNIDLNSVKKDIIYSYEILWDLNVTYQQRLNFVLGKRFPELDSLMEIATFLIDFYQNPFIHPKFKDNYILNGYFDDIELYLDDDDINDPKFLQGKNYFTNTENEDKIMMLAENVNDYFYDEGQQDKDPMFLYGILVRGAEIYEESFESEKKLILDTKNLPYS